MQVANAELSDTPTRIAVLEHRADSTDRALELLRQDMNRGFADLRGQIDHLGSRLDQMSAQINTRLDQQLRWVITTVITTAFAILGANVGLLTLLLRPR